MSTGYADRETIDIDEVVIPEVATTTLTGEEIDKANRFIQIPTGDYTLRVLSFPYGAEEQTVNVEVDGRPQLYISQSLTIRWCLDTDERATIDERVMLPPGNPAHLRAYHEGVETTSKGSKLSPGYAANRFYRIMEALGYDRQPGKPLPVEARRPSNWKGRKCMASIKGGTGTYKANDGSERESKSQVKPFSHQVVGSAPPKAGGSTITGSPVSPSPAPARSAATPKAAAVATGVDDI